MSSPTYWLCMDAARAGCAQLRQSVEGAQLASGSGSAWGGVDLGRVPSLEERVQLSYDLFRLGE
jgi:hypothetical protein